MFDCTKEKLRISGAKVISVSGKETVKVVFFDTVLHKVGKYIKLKRTLICHDQSSLSKIGDIVDVYVCRPLSKIKSHFIKPVV